MTTIVPKRQRVFAVDVVRRLRGAGFEAYWAGGCVRDVLLERTPKDYDVATNATPAEIRALFGTRQTVAVGAAFGVITVLGPEGAGQIEVATFRRDAPYSDGRHPDSVTYSTAREDASRRDFTINGMFFDPLEEQVIDFVGGREDLDRRVVRAIGRAEERISEDKLRMLRAVRFSATLDFTLDAATLRTIQERAGEVTVVSPERIAGEMQRMLVDPHRSHAMRLLLETDLARAVLPEIVPQDAPGRQRLERTLALLDQLEEPSFALALAALVLDWVDTQGAGRISARWKLANRDTDRLGWLVAERGVLAGAQTMPWSALQPILVAEGIDELLALEEALARTGSGKLTHMEFCRERLAQPEAVLNPPPLLTGDDLIAHGVPTGPVYGDLLQQARNAQLDGQVTTKAEALALADRLLGQGEFCPGKTSPREPPA